MALVSIMKALDSMCRVHASVPTSERQLHRTGHPAARPSNRVHPLRSVLARDDILCRAMHAGERAAGGWLHCKTHAERNARSLAAAPVRGAHQRYVCQPGTHARIAHHGLLSGSAKAVIPGLIVVSRRHRPGVVLSLVEGPTQGVFASQMPPCLALSTG